MSLNIEGRFFEGIRRKLVAFGTFDESFEFLYQVLPVFIVNEQDMTATETTESQTTEGITGVANTSMATLVVRQTGYYELGGMCGGHSENTAAVGTAITAVLNFRVTRGGNQIYGHRIFRLVTNTSSTGWISIVTPWMFRLKLYAGDTVELISGAMGAQMEVWAGMYLQWIS